MRNYPGSQLPAKTTWPKLSRRWAAPCLSRTKKCPSSGRGIETNFLHCWLSPRLVQALAWAGMSGLLLLSKGFGEGWEEQDGGQIWYIFLPMGDPRQGPPKTWILREIHTPSLCWPCLSDPFIGLKSEGTGEGMWGCRKPTTVTSRPLWDSFKVTGRLSPSVEDREGWSPSPFRVQQRGPQASDSHLIPFVFT